MSKEIYRIRELEEELSNTPYNKRTQHHIGLVKAKIARLKEKIEKKEAGKGRTVGFALKKTGDATVIFVGFPSVGKSTLLNKLTSAKSKIGDYDFTTLNIVPGLLEYGGAKIQLLDVPGIIEDAAKGKGGGKEALSITRAADLLLILVDAQNPHQIKVISRELYEIGIRLNQKKPDVTLRTTPKGGIIIGKIKKVGLSNESIEGILKELGIMNAEIIIREDITEDQLIDVIRENRVYVPTITAVNKIDTVDERKILEIRKSLKPDIFISAEAGTNLEELKKLVFQKLDFLRIYCKKLGKKPDFNEPIVFKHRATVEDVCQKLHRDFINRFRFARVWGKSAKFPGQRFNLKHELSDRDVIELHLS